jgi:hypothetical protein
LWGVPGSLEPPAPLDIRPASSRGGGPAPRAAASRPASQVERYPMPLPFSMRLAPYERQLFVAVYLVQIVSAKVEAQIVGARGWWAWLRAAGWVVRLHSGCVSFGLW